MELVRYAQVLAWTVLLLGTMMAMPTNADCPDADIRCRIPVADSGMTSSTSGCEVGGEVTGTITGEVPSGSVTINGKCYNTVTDSDQTQYLVVGTITIGQCYNALQGGCQPDHCANNSPAQQCNAQLQDCNIPDMQTLCETSYTVQQGDFAQAVADAQGITLDDLMADNPGIDLSVLQPNERLCVKTTVNSTPKCEGQKISG